MRRSPDPWFELDPDRHGRESVEVPATGSCRIAVVADTHSAPYPGVEALLEREAPACILHAGDIGTLDVLDQLARVAPVFAVRGNIDAAAGGAATGPPDTLTLDLRQQGRLLLTLLLIHIAVRGPRLRRDALALARRHRAGLVVCGHSHVPLLGSTDGVAVFNPGSIGPRRFQLPITFGVIEVKPTGISCRHVDCESGQPWRPAGRGAQISP